MGYRHQLVGMQLSVFRHQDAACTVGDGVHRRLTDTALPYFHQTMCGKDAIDCPTRTNEIAPHPLATTKWFAETSLRRNFSISPVSAALKT